MIIGMEFGNTSGTQPDSWRAPGVDPLEYLDYDARIEHARAAERGKFHFLFFPGGPHRADIERNPPQHSPDLTIHMALIARATERIGLVASGSTTFNHPYLLAQQLKTADYISRGRVGWNVVPSARADSYQFFGGEPVSDEARHGRARESVELVQSLWGSWGRDAWVHDQESGQYTKPGQVASINFNGTYVNSQGPLYVPPSEQGQPVIVHAGVGDNSFALAGRYANLAVGLASSIEEAREHRDAIRRFAVDAGRDPDEVKYVVGFQPTLGATKRDALDRRVSLIASRLPQWVPQLGDILGVPLTMSDLDRVLRPSELGARRLPDPAMPAWRRAWTEARDINAFALANEGWSVRDILAQGVFDEHPAKVGTAAEAADHMQEWFDSGVIDGFWLIVDVYRDGIDAFVDQVVPILQERGLFHRDYEQATLRGHLGAREQYGPDYRVAQTASR